VSETLVHRHYLIVFILAPTLLLFGLAPVSAVASYAPGVKPGDSVTYGQINASWKSSTAPVSPVKDLLGVSSITVVVLNVLGNSVTARQTYTHPNGTTRSIVWAEDTRSGTGNMSSAIEWIIAGSLSSPDPLYDSSSASTIVQTVQGVYAGSVRTVNIINSTQPEPGGFCKFLRVWDQTTGVLLGFALNYTVSNGNYHVSASASAQMTQTNAWVLPAHTGTRLPSPILGLALFLAAAIGSASVYALHVRPSSHRESLKGDGKEPKIIRCSSLAYLFSLV
jgi:hypothetical protein